MHTSSQTNFKTTRQKENARFVEDGLFSATAEWGRTHTHTHTLWTGIDRKRGRDAGNLKLMMAERRSTMTLGGFKENKWSR